jgi:hypothetical protein
MDCREVSPLLAERALGELDPVSRSAVESHLAGCGPCRARAEEVDEATAALRRFDESSLATDSPPADLSAIGEGIRAGAGSGTGLAGALSSGDRARAARTALAIPRWFGRSARAAALVLVAVGLAAALRTRVEAGDGTVTIAFVAPWSSAGAAPNEGDRESRLSRANLGAGDAGDPFSVPVGPGTAPASEPVEAAVRVAVEESVEPTFRRLVALLAEAEERHARELASILSFLGETRREDAAAFASILADTRNEVRTTQAALLQVAEQYPLRRMENW